MKLRTATPASVTFATKMALIFMSILIAFAVPMYATQKVSAETIDEINARYEATKAVIQRQIDVYNAEAATLAAEAATLQSAIAVLQNQAAIIQAQIDVSQLRYDQLIEQITSTEKRIKDNQDALGVTIADMYVDGKITPVEMLASSNNIGDFLDKQEYRSSVRDELTSTISEIKTLKEQLSAQKVEVERVLTDQKNQHLALAGKQSEQQKILTETQGKESAYTQMSNESKSQIEQLRIQQASELAARARSTGGRYTSSDGDGSRGGYPSSWMNAPLDAYVDPWGMYTRECVSYAAFKVDQAYGNMPYWGGIGNANQWDDNARNLGIPMGSTPKPGSVGVIDGGTYGHVGWVESVNGDGTINISHFNINWNGDYAEWYNLSPSYFNYYIYFGEW